MRLRPYGTCGVFDHLDPKGWPRARARETREAMRHELEADEGPLKSPARLWRADLEWREMVARKAHQPA